jgi:hypothetical protein
MAASASGHWSARVAHQWAGRLAVGEQRRMAQAVTAALIATEQSPGAAGATAPNGLPRVWLCARNAKSCREQMQQMNVAAALIRSPRRRWREAWYLREPASLHFQEWS